MLVGVQPAPDQVTGALAVNEALVMLFAKVAEHVTVPPAFGVSQLIPPGVLATLPPTVAVPVTVTVKVFAPQFAFEGSEIHRSTPCRLTVVVGDPEAVVNVQLPVFAEP